MLPQSQANPTKYSPPRGNKVGGEGGGGVGGWWGWKFDRLYYSASTAKSFPPPYTPSSSVGGVSLYCKLHPRVKYNAQRLSTTT
jgi:hypothetical protein